MIYIIFRFSYFVKLFTSEIFLFSFHIPSFFFPYSFFLISNIDSMCRLKLKYASEVSLFKYDNTSAKHLLNDLEIVNLHFCTRPICGSNVSFYLPSLNFPIFTCKINTDKDYLFFTVFILFIIFLVFYLIKCSFGRFIQLKLYNIDMII